MIMEAAALLVDDMTRTFFFIDNQYDKNFVQKKSGGIRNQSQSMETTYVVRH